ncbi:glycine--tRNA ligase subunit alpha [bacterium]|nr:glycine--tRNA ligase subunit alpha [bacterium]
MALTFQDLILKLQEYWKERGAAILIPYDDMMGAGTFHPGTFFNSLKETPYSCCYVQPCRRPKDGRYGENPNRWQRYYQFQVFIHPSPEDIQAIYMGSLKHIGIPIEDHDVKFLEDDWESPTLGAWGLGWEVWLDGLEITQFTYFQQIGGVSLEKTPVELTYGLERIAMFIQDKKDIKDIDWSEDITYGELALMSEVDGSRYNFEHSDPKVLFDQYHTFENEGYRMLDLKNVYAAYDNLLKCSHTFNLLDARGVISVSERAHYIKKIRTVASKTAQLFRDLQEEDEVTGKSK